MNTIGKTVLALGLTAALATASAPSVAAPVMTSTAVMKQGVASDVEQVRWRGRGGGWAAAGVGFAAGAVLGSAIANSNRYGYGYYGGPYYAAPAYGYYDAPVAYAAPAPVYETYAAPAPRGRCWISTGGDGRYGYWSVC